MLFSLIHPLKEILVCCHVIEGEPLARIEHDGDGDILLLCDRAEHDWFSEGVLRAMRLDQLWAAFPMVATLDHLPVGHVATLRSDGGWAVSVLEGEDGPPPAGRGALTELDDLRWTCACCDKAQRGVPDMAFISPAEVARRDGHEDWVLREDSDLCVLHTDGQTDHFHRAVLPVPLPFAAPGAAGVPRYFGFGVWCSLSKVNFERYEASFDDDDQARLGGMFTYLGHSLPGYPDTRNLTLVSMPQNGGQRPMVFLLNDHEEHPLFADQRDGWDMATLEQRLATMMRH